MARKSSLHRTQGLCSLGSVLGIGGAAAIMEGLAAAPLADGSAAGTQLRNVTPRGRTADVHDTVRCYRPCKILPRSGRRKCHTFGA